MNKDIRRGLLIPAVAVLLTAVNFLYIKDSEGVRAIHIVSLLVMGFALGILVMNLITYFKNKNQ